VKDKRSKGRGGGRAYGRVGQKDVLRSRGGSLDERRSQNKLHQKKRTTTKEYDEIGQRGKGKAKKRDNSAGGEGRLKPGKRKVLTLLDLLSVSRLVQKKGVLGEKRGRYSDVCESLRRKGTRNDNGSENHSGRSKA